ncbi:MAG: head decoration protein [Candidatus Bilamarchaeaceae archaeon]
MAPNTAVGFSPGVPGFTDVRASYESSVLYQSFFMGDVVFASGAVISSQAQDAGNTPPSLLRPGLVMAQLDATGEWVDYDETATDGSQEAKGVLVNEIYLQDYTTAASAARAGNVIVVAGKAIASRLICGTGGLTLQARRQLTSRGFRFDDDDRVSPIDADFTRVDVRTSDYSLVSRDHGRLITNLGGTTGVTFTLPALATNIGFKVEFLSAADVSFTVASAEGSNIVFTNNLSATSLTFNTANQRIGGRLVLEAVRLGSTPKWLARNLSSNTVTVA